MINKVMLLIFKVTREILMALVTMVTVSEESVSSSCCICHLRIILLYFSQCFFLAHILTSLLTGGWWNTPASLRGE